MEETKTMNQQQQNHSIRMDSRVKSGKFGRSAKFRQRPCLFHILIIGIKIN